MKYNQLQKRIKVFTWITSCMVHHVVWWKWLVGNSMTGWIEKPCLARYPPTITHWWEGWCLFQDKVTGSWPYSNIEEMKEKNRKIIFWACFINWYPSEFQFCILNVPQTHLNSIDKLKICAYRLHSQLKLNKEKYQISFLWTHVNLSNS